MPKKELSLLSETLKGVKRNIENLGKLKNVSVEEENLIKTILDSTASKEKELRVQIAMLIKQEAMLNNKKDKIDKKIMNIQKNLDKIKDIKNQIEGV